MQSKQKKKWTEKNKNYLLMPKRQTRQPRRCPKLACSFIFAYFSPCTLRASRTFLITGGYGTPINRMHIKQKTANSGFYSSAGGFDHIKLQFIRRFFSLLQRIQQGPGPQWLHYYRTAAALRLKSAFFSFANRLLYSSVRLVDSELVQPSLISHEVALYMGLFLMISETWSRLISVTLRKGYMLHFSGFTVADITLNPKLHPTILLAFAAKIRPASDIIASAYSPILSS